MKYIDVHCHLNASEYDADRDAVIRRAEEAGVGMIVVGVDPASSQSAVALAEKHQNMWAIVGLHPTEAGFALERNTTRPNHDIFDYDFYKKLALHPKVVGIGECGLDYFHNHVDSSTDSSVANQIKIFEDQIRLAHEVKRPLMLHVRNGVNHNSRDAYKDVVAILKKSKAVGMNVIGNVHFFAGNLETARQFLDLGFYLSFTGAITFNKAEKYHEIIRAMPLDRILSETDAPFVAPAPYRGKRNEPAYVVEVARAIALIRAGQDDGKVVSDTLVKNARKLFDLS